MCIRDSHWGIEYQNSPNSHQTELAKFLVEQGADLVLGGHPHVLQPYETISVTGWDGQEREGFVCYSLGNFISNQYDPAPATMTTAILDLELTKAPDGTTSVTKVGYVPYYMIHRDSAPVGEKRFLLNIHQAMEEYEACLLYTSFGRARARRPRPSSHRATAAAPSHSREGSQAPDASPASQGTPRQASTPAARQTTRARRPSRWGMGERRLLGRGVWDVERGRCV